MREKEKKKKVDSKQLYISNMLTSTPFIYSITRVINRAIIISESVIHW